MRLPRYCRISADEQGQFRLSLGIQRAAVALHTLSIGAKAVAEFQHDGDDHQVQP